MKIRSSFLFYARFELGFEGINPKNQVGEFIENKRDSKFHHQLGLIDHPKDRFLIGFKGWWELTPTLQKIRFDFQKLQEREFNGIMKFK